MRRPRHVCILTTAHPADDVRVNNKFAYAFRAAGFRVSWVGPKLTFFDANNYDRHGLEYHLFQPKKGRIGRIYAHHQALRLAEPISGVDVFYVPDPDAAFAALRLAGHKRGRVIFDIHEIFHGGRIQRWFKGPLASVAAALVHRNIASICSRCDLVLGVSQAVLDPYIMGNCKSMVVRSCAPSWFADRPPADVCGHGRAELILIHGKNSMSRGTMQVLDALRIASEQVGNLRTIMFDTDSGDISAQSGQSEFQSIVRRLGVTNMIDLKEGVPMQEMPAILQTCDVGLISYDRKLGVGSLPNRLFEFMAAGLAIMAPSYAVEIASIIRSEECGVLVDFEKPEAIAEGMVYLHTHREECRMMGQRARMAFEKRHNWEVEVAPVLDQIQEWVQ